MSIILSTFKDHKLTDRQHSAVFYALGLSNATVDGYGNNLEVTKDKSNKNKIGINTGIGFIKGRMFEITEPELFDIQPNHYFRIYVVFDGWAGSVKVKLEQSHMIEFKPPFDDGGNIQQDPNEVAMYTLAYGSIGQDTDSLKYNNNNHYFSISEILEEMKNMKDMMASIGDELVGIEEENNKITNLLEEVFNKLKNQNEKIEYFEMNDEWILLYSFENGKSPGQTIQVSDKEKCFELYEEILFSDAPLSYGSKPLIVKSYADIREQGYVWGGGGRLWAGSSIRDHFVTVEMNKANLDSLDYTLSKYGTYYVSFGSNVSALGNGLLRSIWGRKRLNNN